MSIVRKVYDGILGAIHTLMHGRPSTWAEVAKQLDEIVVKKHEDLNWRTSAVDLMKTLDRDSSLEARRDLADELGYEGDFEDTAKMNTWLIEKMLSEIANHYVDVPGKS